MARKCESIRLLRDSSVYWERAVSCAGELTRSTAYLTLPVRKFSGAPRSSMPVYVELVACSESESGTVSSLFHADSEKFPSPCRARVRFQRPVL